jgi:hypothetical protein
MAINATSTDDTTRVICNWHNSDDSNGSYVSIGYSAEKSTAVNDSWYASFSIAELCALRYCTRLRILCVFFRRHPTIRHTMSYAVAHTLMSKFTAMLDKAEVEHMMVIQKGRHELKLFMFAHVSIVETYENRLALHYDSQTDELGFSIYLPTADGAVSLAATIMEAASHNRCSASPSKTYTKYSIVDVDGASDDD